MAWAASPSSASRPRTHGQHAHRDERPDGVAGELAGEILEQVGGVRIVASEAWWMAAGSSSPANPAGPSNGQNSVAVNVWSRFGKAIIIESPRGQMCNAPGSRANSPAPSGAIVSSLYPHGRCSWR